MINSPKLPRIESLSKKHVQELELFIEKHELGIHLGRYKTTRFVYNLYKQEELKRKKKEKYSRKLLKDAENLIMGLQFAHRRPLRAPMESGGGSYKGKRKLKAVPESEEIQTETKEDRIRKRLKKLLKADSEKGEKLVKQLLKRKDGQKFAERIEKIVDGLAENKEVLGRFLHFHAEDVVNELEHADKLLEQARKEQGAGNHADAFEKFTESALIYSELYDQQGMRESIPGLLREAILSNQIERMDVMEDIHNFNPPEEQIEEIIGGLPGAVLQMANELEKQGNTSRQAFYLKEMWSFFRDQVGEGGEEYADKALKLFLELEDYSSAADILRKRAHDLRDADEGAAAELSLRAAEVHMKAGEYEKAASEYLLVFSEKDGKLFQGILPEMLRIAETKERTEELAESADAYAAAAKLTEKIEGAEEEASALMEKAGDMFVRAGKFIGAKEKYEDALEVSSERNEEIQGKLSTIRVAVAEEKERKGNNAIYAYKEAAEDLSEKDPEKASDLYKKIIELALKESYTLSEAADAYQNLAKLNPNQADEILAEGAKTLVSKAGELEELWEHHNASRAYKEAAELEQNKEKRISLLLKRAAILEKMGPEKDYSGEIHNRAAQVYRNIAWEYKEIDKEKAAEFYIKSAQLRGGTREENEVSNLYGYAAKMLEELDPERAAELLVISGEKAEELGKIESPSYLAKGYYLEAAELLEEIKPKKAAAIYEKVAEMCAEMDYSYEAIIQYYEKALLLSEGTDDRSSPLGRKLLQFEILDGRIQEGFIKCNDETRRWAVDFAEEQAKKFEAEEKFRKAAKLWSFVLTSKFVDPKTPEYRKMAVHRAELGILAGDWKIATSSFGTLSREEEVPVEYIEAARSRFIPLAQQKEKAGEHRVAGLAYRAAADILGHKPDANAPHSKEVSNLYEKSGEMMAGAGDYHKSAEDYLESLNTDKGTARHIPTRIGKLLLSIAEKHEKEGEYEKAYDAYANFANAVSKARPRLSLDWHEKASESAVRAGRYSGALEELHRAMRLLLKDKITSQSSIETIVTAAKESDQKTKEKIAGMFERCAEISILAGDAKAAKENFHHYQRVTNFERKDEKQKHISRMLEAAQKQEQEGTHNLAGDFYYDAAFMGGDHKSKEFRSIVLEAARNYEKAAESDKIFGDKKELFKKTSASYHAAAVSFMEETQESYSFRLKSAHFSEKAAEYARAASSYNKAAKLIEGSNPILASEHYLKAAEMEVYENNDARIRHLYEKAIKLNPSKEPEMREFIVSNLISHAEKRHAAEEHFKSASLYYCAALILEGVDPIMASVYAEKSGDSHVLAGSLDSAAREYLGAASVIKDSDPKRHAALMEKQLVLSVIFDTWKENEDYVKSNYPELYELLSDPTPNQQEFLKGLRATMDVEKFVQVLKTFQLIESQVGINPARKNADFALISQGINEWKESGFREIKGVPQWFSFQAWAAAKGDAEKEAIFEKICNSKDFRNTKDRRKELMWYLEDNGEKESPMAAFFHTASISSSKKLFSNLRYLAIVQQIDPKFNVIEKETQKELVGSMQQAVVDFINKRSPSEKVSKEFLKKLGQLNSSGFLPAIVTMYSKYFGYAGMDGLLDIALVSITMGDFQKVKFPTKEGIEGMDYLTDAQKGILLASADQLAFLGTLDSKWMEDVEVISIPEEAEENAELIKQDLAQRIADLKFHFTDHLTSQEGDLEKEFSFEPGTLKKIHGLAKELEARDQRKSPEYRKLKQIERIMVSVQKLEKIDALKAAEMSSEIKSILRDLGQSTAALFKGYGLSSEDLESLQAKMDIDLLRRLLLEEKEKLKIEKMTAYDSADPVHLILAGKEPDNSGSCQRYDGTPSLMAGLSGYLLNAHTKIIRVENQDGLVLGRAMLRALTADGKPALFLERFYYRNAHANPEVDRLIIEAAKKKADSMGIPLLSTSHSTERRTMHIVVGRGLSRYEYSDGLGGGARGGVNNETDLELSEL